MTFVFTTNDKYVIKCDQDVLHVSNLFRNLMSCQSSEIIQINIPNIHMIDIIEYLNLRYEQYEIEAPLKHFNFSKCVSDYDCKFMDRFNDIHYLTEFINSVDYLDIPHLLNLSCAKLCSLIKNLQI